MLNASKTYNYYVINSKINSKNNAEIINWIAFVKIKM